jgi:dsDNA-specific endonuclease/ATPase MutS2
MTIAGHTPCQIYSQDKFILEEANIYLIRITRETITEAEQVARILDNDSPSSRDVAALNSLRKKAGEFEVVIQSMKDTSEAHIIARFFSLSGQNQNVKSLLSHFTDELKSIARDFINRARDDETVLSRIIEVCYNQSLSCSGVLHHDRYSIPLRRAI